MTRTSGAHQFQMVLSQLSMTPGDFDADGFVNDVDLATWRQNFGMAENARRTDGDADADGDVDGADFLAWQQRVGFSSASAAVNTVVPEPAAWLLILFAATGVILSRAKHLL
jgi:hypothetical protein